MMKNIGRILFCIGLLMRGNLGEAAEQEHILQLQNQVEQRVLSIVKPYDQNALVFARVYLKTESKVLPGTPFFAKDLTVQGEMGLSEISKALVIIMSQKKPFSQTVLNTAKTVLEAEKVPVVFQVDELPAELKGPEKTEATLNQESREIWLDGVNQLRYLYRVMMGLVAVFVVAVLMDLRRKNNSALLKLLEEGINKLTSTESRGAVIDQPITQLQQAAALPSELTPGSRSDIWSQYADETLEACLSDCYWCEQDGYAHYVWMNLPPAKRKALLSKLSFLPQYVEHFTTLEPISGKWVDDIAYLQPVHLSHIDNSALAGAIKGQPSLFASLSKMRQASVPIEVHERIMLSRLEAKDPSSISSGLTQIAASAPRPLRRRLQLDIRNEEQERAVLAFSPFSLELAEDVPSLGWLLRLPEASRTSLLEQYSARDLASAWVGPAEVMSQLERSIPEKKMEVIRSYLSARPGSRASAVYLDIHRRGIQQLKSTETEGTPEETGELSRAQAA